MVTGTAGMSTLIQPEGWSIAPQQPTWKGWVIRSATVFAKLNERIDWF